MTPLSPRALLVRPVRAALLALALLAAGGAARAEPTEETEGPPKLRLFYFDQAYGSEAQFNPATVILNVGLMAYGTLGQDPRLQALGSGGAAARLRDAYVHPLDAMRGRGTIRNFLFGEFVVGAFPLLPNMYLHLLGEGMVSRKLEEYLLDRGLSPGWAKALAIATIVAAQQLNELNEQQSSLTTCSDETTGCRRLIDGADSLADTAFFNFAGILLFQFDTVAGLFASDYVGLHYWPGQPLVDVGTGRVFAQGEAYRLGVMLPWTSIRFAYISGAPLGAAAGLTVPIHGAHALTASYGTYNRYVEHPAAIEAEDWALLSAFSSVNLHWDRGGSLMASLLTRTDLGGFQLSAYPGIVDVDVARHVGLFAQWSKETEVAAGVTLSFVPLLPGLAVGGG